MQTVLPAGIGWRLNNTAIITAMKKIKQGRWSRQIHLANAGIRAGFGWAADQISTVGLPSGEKEIVRASLMQKQAENWVKQLGQLKGSIVKIGQILATYADYCLPTPLASALHQLEAETESLAWSAISPHITDSLHNRQQELIIEPIALAAASLSQVHKARIKTDHRIICLKILYPGIAETMDSDLITLEKSLGWWLKKEEQERFSLWISSIHDVLSEEINLQQEAVKLKRWRALLGNDSRYVVPVVEGRFCGDNILAMSFEQGVVQHDESVISLPMERRNRLAENMLELFFREIFIWGEMQTDPHPGNYRIRIDAEKGDTIVLLDFGSVRKIGETILQPLRKMILGAYRDERDTVLRSLLAMGLLDQSAPDEVKQAFADVLLGLVEPLNYRARLAKDPDSVPSYAIDNELNYCWADAKLPKRMGKQAIQSAFSQHFSFPGADFLLLSRKLAGVYAFIASMDAHFDASIVLEKVISEMPGEYI